MATFPGTNIPLDASGNARVNAITDNLLTPRMQSFREICIYDEQAHLLEDGATWKLTYGNWHSAFQITVRKNGQVIALTTAYTAVSNTNGTLELVAVDKDASGRSLDTVTVTYQFDYFPIDILQGYIIYAIDYINAAAFGPPTNFTIADAPNYWDSTIADVAFATAMEKLSLDFDLWKGRLVFALGPGVLEGDAGDITSQLSLLKENAWERVNRALDNEKFKHGNILAAPTPHYFDAVRGVGGRAGTALPSTGGRLRGWKPSKYI